MQIAKNGACFVACCESQCGVVLEHRSLVIKQVGMPVLEPVPAVMQSK